MKNKRYRSGIILIAFLLIQENLVAKKYLPFSSEVSNNKDNIPFVKSLENNYFPYLQAGGTRFFNVKGSSSAMGLDLFMPLLQPPNHLVFTDLRLYDRSGTPFEGNVHLGYRHLLPEKQMLYGIYLAFDRKRSNFGNYFNQLTFGAEYWFKQLFIGGNFYQPIGTRTRFLGIKNQKGEVVLTDKTILITTNKQDEKAVGGGDVEVGYEFNKGLIGYVGGYYFKEKGTQAIFGPKAKLAYDWILENNQRFLGMFEKVGLEAGVQNDKTRGTTWYLSLNLRLGLVPTRHNNNLQGVERHMVDLVRRDVDIVVAEAASREQYLHKEGDKILKIKRVSKATDGDHLLDSPKVGKDFIQRTVSDNYDYIYITSKEGIRNEIYLASLPIENSAEGTSRSVPFPAQTSTSQTPQNAASQFASLTQPQCSPDEAPSAQASTSQNVASDSNDNTTFASSANQDSSSDTREKEKSITDPYGSTGETTNDNNGTTKNAGKIAVGVGATVAAVTGVWEAWSWWKNHKPFFDATSDGSKKDGGDFKPPFDEGGGARPDSKDNKNKKKPPDVIFPTAPIPEPAPVPTPNPRPVPVLAPAPSPTPVPVPALTTAPAPVLEPTPTPMPTPEPTPIPEVAIVPPLPTVPPIQPLQQGVENPPSAISNETSPRAKGAENPPPTISGETSPRTIRFRGEAGLVTRCDGIIEEDNGVICFSGNNGGNPCTPSTSEDEDPNGSLPQPLNLTKLKQVAQEPVGVKEQQADDSAGEASRKKYQELQRVKELQRQLQRPSLAQELADANANDQQQGDNLIKREEEQKDDDRLKNIVQPPIPTIPPYPYPLHFQLPQSRRQPQPQQQPQQPLVAPPTHLSSIAEMAKDKICKMSKLHEKVLAEGSGSLRSKFHQHDGSLRKFKKMIDGKKTSELGADTIKYVREQGERIFDEVNETIEEADKTSLTSNKLKPETTSSATKAYVGGLFKKQKRKNKKMDNATDSLLPPPPPPPPPSAGASASSSSVSSSASFSSSSSSMTSTTQGGSTSSPKGGGTQVESEKVQNKNISVSIRSNDYSYQNVSLSFNKQEQKVNAPKPLEIITKEQQSTDNWYDNIFGWAALQASNFWQASNPSVDNIFNDNKQVFSSSWTNWGIVSAIALIQMETSSH